MPMSLGGELVCLRVPEGIDLTFPGTCPDTSWDKLPLGNLSLLCLNTRVTAFESSASNAEVEPSHSAL